MPHFLYYQQKDIFMVEQDLLFHIEDNLTDEKRVGHITVTDGDVTKVITVTQLPNKIVFVPSSSITIDDSEQNVTFAVEYGGLGTLEVVSAETWQEVTQLTSSSMTVHVPDYITGTTNRGGNVAITDGTISGWASITQLTQWIRFDETSSSAMSMSAESSGDSYSITFKEKDIDEMFTLTDSPSWITGITLIQGNGTPKPYRLQFDLLTNTLSVPRTGTVTITDGNRHYAVLTIEQKQYVPEPEKGLTFVAKQTNTSVSLSKVGSPTALSFEYIINDSAWQPYTIGSSVTLSSVGDTVKFRNVDDTHSTFSTSTSDYYKFNITGKCNVENDISYLIRKNGYDEDFYINENAFYSLFGFCSGIIDASDLILPFQGEDMGANCYNSMFRYCTGLTDAPALPADNLPDCAYNDMFRNCTSLTGAPVLPAMTIGDSVYAGMFAGCTSLVNPPALPATSITTSCYSVMFSNCTSLTAAPVLPAMTLEPYCYNGMFEGCTSLVTVPSLPATALSESCYESMFYNCTSLSTVPTLSAETLVDFSYFQMFYGCSNLTAITCLATDISTFKCTTDWVNGVPTAGTFTRNATMNDWTIDSTSGIPYHWTVVPPYVEEEGLTFVATQSNSKVSLSKIGSPTSISLQYSTNDGSTWTNYTFGNSITLSSVGSKVMFRNTSTTTTNFSTSSSNYYRFNITGKCDAENDISYLINKNGNILTIPNNYCFFALFSGCTGLVSVDENLLPATTLTKQCYMRMFQSCTNLVNSPFLPATVLPEECYRSLFDGATAVTEIKVFGATALSYQCCYNMCLRCYSLTGVPALMAETLADSSYRAMFYQCTSLTSITCLATSITANQCTYDWVNGVPTAGTFTKAASMTSWSMYVTSGVPYHWGVEDYIEGIVLTPAMSSVTYNATGVTSIITKGSDVGTLTVSTDSPSWITSTTINGNQLSIHFTTNSLPTERVGIVTVSDGVYSAEYTLTQGYQSPAIVLTPSTESVSYTATGTSVQITKAGYVGTLTASTTATWITSYTELIGGSYLYISFPENEELTSRTAEFTVTDGVYSATYILTQKPKSEGLTFVAKQTNSKVSLNKVSTPPGGRLEYSTNNGITWTEYTIGSSISLPNVDDTVMFRNMSTSSTFSQSYNIYYRFNITGKCNVENDITYLFNKNGNVDRIPSYYCFINLFSGCTGLCDASRLLLPSTGLYDNCYHSMFNGCTSLTAAPALPATTLAQSCYKSMFAGCTSLTSAPSLPATTLANYCYEGMFDGCTSLTSAPSILPATALAVSCYHGMFIGCTSLTSAPSLPATTLANYCYDNMFSGCTSLTSAPALPATTLAGSCYDSMFIGCTSLTSITCLATSITATDCTYWWVYGVSSTGTFTKAASMTSWPRGQNGIPNGWSVEDYSITLIPAAATVGYNVVTASTIIAKAAYIGTLTASTTAEWITNTTINDNQLIIDFTVNTTTASREGIVTVTDGVYSATYTLTQSPEGDGLTFIAKETNSKVVLRRNYLPTPVSFEYSTDGGMAWKTYNFGNVINLSNIGDTVKFHNTSEDTTNFNIDFSNYYGFSITGKCDCEGDITYLINKNGNVDTIPCNNCFINLFSGCTGLVTAPVLPATALTEGCYYMMFRGCQSLTSITCLATSITANQCTYNWVYGVSSTGTFTKAAGANWTTGDSGIPNNWTVIDAP